MEKKKSFNKKYKRVNQIINIWKGLKLQLCHLTKRAELNFTISGVARRITHFFNWSQERSQRGRDLDP